MIIFSMSFVILLSFCGTTLGCKPSSNEEPLEDYLDYGECNGKSCVVIATAVATSEQSMCHIFILTCM